MAYLILINKTTTLRTWLDGLPEVLWLTLGITRTLNGLANPSISEIETKEVSDLIRILLKLPCDCRTERQNLERYFRSNRRFSDSQSHI